MGLLAAGWVGADLRRGDRGWIPAIPLFTVAVSASVLLATGSPGIAALAMVGAAALAIAANRPFAGEIGAVMGLLALRMAHHDPIVVGVGALAALAIAFADRRDESDLMAGASAVIVLLAALLGSPYHGPAVSIAGAVVFCWLLAAGLEEQGQPVRLVSLALLLAIGGQRPETAIAGAIAFTVLALVDAIRLDDPNIGVGAGLASVICLRQTGTLAGLKDADLGIAMAGFGLVVAALGSIADRRWRTPFIVTTALALLSGFGLTHGNQQATGDVLMIAGAMALAAAAMGDGDWTAHAGGFLLVAGAWNHLAAAHVHALEFYVAPVSGYLLAAGAVVRRRDPSGTSSWIAYGPAIGAFGGAALVERLGGGPGWHAVVAGAVGVVAVAIGGWRRLVAPMLIGTALLVLVVGHEVLALSAGVPTWAWLAAAGSVLLGLGVQLERSDTSPIEAGRRVSAVLAERFQ
jgi:hypothetical protein